MSQINLDGKVIAVDFDGTIVENNYPRIGEEMLFAFMTLKELQNKGHRLILWTYRADEELDEAVNFCLENGLTFFAVNENYPGESQEGTFSRKINADIFIDDRNIGGFMGWSEVWKSLHPEGGEFSHVLKNKVAHYNGKGIKDKGKKGWMRYFKF